MNETVPIPVAVLNAIVSYLRNGGSYVEASLLADKLIYEANAPARVQAQQDEINAAVTKKLTEDKHKS